VKFKQFPALPYRMRDNDVEILLITTRKKRRWSVPKGCLSSTARLSKRQRSRPTKKQACGFRGLRPGIPIERDHAFRSKAAT
jgi:hypothetical protein